MCVGLKKLLPEEYIIETTSNKTKYHHGADILITIPDLRDRKYIIAIQIKDYESVIGEWVIDQICKADD